MPVCIGSRGLLRDCTTSPINRSPDLLPGAAVGGQEAARVVEAGLAQPQLQQRHVAPPAGQLAPALCLACNMPRVTGATCEVQRVYLEQCPDVGGVEEVQQPHPRHHLQTQSVHPPSLASSSPR